MMEYAQYQQQAPQGHHPQGQPHLQNSYSNSGQHPGSAGPLNSSANQTLHQQNSLHTQASPILPSQQQHAQNQGHGAHQPMYAQSGYGVAPPGMYGMTGITPHAAAMAATAAASGQGYYNLPGDPSLPQTSPSLGGMPIKKDTNRGPRSPPQMSHQMNAHQLPQVQQARRVSQQIQSPVLPTSQPLINHGVPRQVPASMPPAPVQQQAQSPEMVTGPAEDSPLYVNAKQFHRILKRRVARQRLEDALRLTSKGRKPYLHESRHNHAMRRPRGPGGRFLTADEVADIERKEAEKAAGGGDGEDVKPDVSATPAKSAATNGPSSGTKRKAETEDTLPVKKAKTTTQGSSDEDQEDEEGEDDG